MTKMYSFLNKLLIFILVIGLMIGLCKCNTSINVNFNLNLKEIIEREEIQDLSLTIYYTDPAKLTYMPWSTEILMEHCDQKFVIDGNALYEQMDLIKQIDDISLHIDPDPPGMNCRVYYVLESKKNGVLFDVILMNVYTSNSVVVNGEYVCSDEGLDVFYRVITPFVTEAVANKILNRLGTDV